MAPTPTPAQPGEEELVPRPEKGAALYWGESLMSASSGMMSSMFGVSPESPKTERPGEEPAPALPSWDTADKRGMMLLSGMSRAPLSTVPENHPMGVLESVATIFGSSLGSAGQQQGSSSASVVTTQLPGDRTTVGAADEAAFTTQVPARAQDQSTRAEPDPMATMRGTPPTNSSSTLFGSRLAMFSLVGRREEDPPGVEEPCFGPPPMIQLVKEQKSESSFRWLCCGAPTGIEEMTQ